MYVRLFVINPISSIIVFIVLVLYFLYYVFNNPIVFINSFSARVGPRLCPIVVLVPSQGEIKRAFCWILAMSQFLRTNLERSK